MKNWPALRVRRWTNCVWDYKAQLVRDGQATPATFKDLTGLSRKYIIPLMEYFDASKLTVRGRPPDSAGKP